MHVAQREDRGDHEEERDAVQPEAHHHAEGGEGHAGDDRADDAREIELDGVEGDGVGQVFLADKGGDERLIRRPAKGLRTAADTRQTEDVPDLDMVVEDEAGEHEGHRHLHDLRYQHHVPPIAAVGDHAGHQRQQQDRQFAEKAVEPEIERRLRAGERDDQPRLRHLLHPGPNAGCEGAEPEEPEIAIGEGGRDAARIRDELRLQVW